MHERDRAKGTFRERLNPNAEEIGWPGVGMSLAQRALTFTKKDPLNPKP